MEVSRPPGRLGCGAVRQESRRCCGRAGCARSFVPSVFSWIGRVCPAVIAAAGSWQQQPVRVVCARSFGTGAGKRKGLVCVCSRQAYSCGGRSFVRSFLGRTKSQRAAVERLTSHKVDDWMSEKQSRKSVNTDGRSGRDAAKRCE